MNKTTKLTAIFLSVAMGGVAIVLYGLLFASIYHILFGFVIALSPLGIIAQFGRSLLSE